MNTIHIDSIKPTAKSLVLKCGDREYFAKKDSGISAGMTIEAETKTSEYNGKSYVWVEKWKQASNGSAAPQSAPQDASGVNMAFMPFVSNVVAHAIQAGRIQTPDDLGKWAQAAYTTAHGLLPF